MGENAGQTILSVLFPKIMSERSDSNQSSEQLLCLLFSLLQSEPRPFHPIRPYKSARCFLLQMSLTSLHLIPPVCVLLLLFTPSLYPFICFTLPLHQSSAIPPAPCALTALSLDGSSSSEAVTMMDCRLPQPLPPPLPFALLALPPP